MGWRDLLQKSEDETMVLPWFGGRSLQSSSRGWLIEGKLPQEYGWHTFSLKTRKAKWEGPAEPNPDVLKFHVTGYLVGDRMVPDDVTSRLNIKRLAGFEQVQLIEPGLDKFVRIKAGRTHDSGALIYQDQEFPLGPEDDVLNAFLDEKESISDIPSVPPALDGAFRIEDWRRIEVRRRREEERKRRELEEKNRKFREQLGDGALRREMALHDFGAAAKAALAVGGAEYVDHRATRRNTEMAVRFKLSGRRYECTCDRKTLRIIDSGICLTAHYDDPDFESGTRGDTFFTLESLPPVIREANGDGVLVVFRHAE